MNVVRALAAAVVGTAVAIAGLSSAAQAQPVAVAPAAIKASVTANAAPAFVPTKAAKKYKVVKVIDGDTIKLSNGTTVRLIGIDTPEKGKCGYAEAKKKLTKLVQGKKVTVPNPKSVKDKDKYGRALRYVSVGGKDVAPIMIKSGYANARYDGVDGYQKHPNQSSYRKLDGKTSHKCGKKVDALGNKKPAKKATKPAASSSGKPTATGKEPWNQPGPDLNCSDIRQWVRITGKDYHGLDRDGDGYGCDSYK